MQRVNALARYREAMTPTSATTDDAWSRMRAQLESEATPPVRRVIPMRWTIAVALAAAAALALAIGLGSDVFDAESRTLAPSQASDQAVTTPPEHTSERSVPALPPAEILAPTIAPTPTPPPARAVVPATKPTPPVRVVSPIDAGPEAIALEAELLRRIEKAIAGKQMPVARTLLAEYTRRFAEGHLAREISMLRIVVACHDGDAKAIDVAVRRHAAAHPGDPANARLRAQPCAKSTAP